MAILEMKSVSKIYGSVYALNNVDFSVEQGEWVAVMGPSGSGKSTMLNIVGCLDTASKGQVLIDGIDTSTLSRKDLTRVRREKIGFVFQQFHLVPHLTALENVMMAQYYHSMADENEAKEALSRVGLGHRFTHFPSQLSGGEQQRVCIARALINYPALILADEPTGNLDEANEEIVVDLFRQLHKEGHTIVMVTHAPEVGSLAERRVRLEHGVVKEVQE
ncbi:MAG: ABC transporter ATP-binding protein [Bacillota bacterium]